jgi:hypothetical protein
VSNRVWSNTSVAFNRKAAFSVCGQSDIVKATLTDVPFDYLKECATITLLHSPPCWRIDLFWQTTASSSSINETFTDLWQA